MAARSDGGSAALEARAALVKALRAHRPEKLVAVVGGERRDVAVPRRAHRWERVATVLESLDWTRLECLDAKGQLLGVIEGEAAAGDDVGDVPADLALGPAPAGLDREHGMLLMMCKAQELALRHQKEAMSVVVDGYRSLAEVVFTRLQALEAIQERTLKLAHDAAGRVSQGGGEHDATDEVMLKLVDRLGGGDDKKLEQTFERVARKVLPEGMLKPVEKKLTNGAGGGAKESA